MQALRLKEPHHRSGFVLPRDQLQTVQQEQIVRTDPQEIPLGVYPSWKGCQDRHQYS